jgi:hypothetical protein
MIGLINLLTMLGLLLGGPTHRDRATVAQPAVLRASASTFVLYILDPDGAAVAGVTFTIEDADGQRHMATTDAEGQARLEGLPGATVWIVAATRQGQTLTMDTNDPKRGGLRLPLIVGGEQRLALVVDGALLTLSPDQPAPAQPFPTNTPTPTRPPRRPTATPVPTEPPATIAPTVDVSIVSTALATTAPTADTSLDHPTVIGVVASAIATAPALEPTRVPASPEVPTSTPADPDVVAPHSGSRGLVVGLVLLLVLAGAAAVLVWRGRGRQP